MRNLKRLVKIILAFTVFFSSFNALSLEKRDGLVIIKVDFDDEDPGAEPGLSDNHGIEGGTNDTSDRVEIDPHSESDVAGMWKDEYGADDKATGNKGNGTTGKSKKGSDNEEVEKFNNFLVQAQQDLINETHKFETGLSGTINDVGQNYIPSIDIDDNGNKDIEDKRKVFEGLVTGIEQEGLLTGSIIGTSTKEKARYTSPQKDKLNQVRQKLNSKRPLSPQQANAKIAGLQALIYSDNAYNVADDAQGDFYFEIAKHMASFVTDFNPVASVAKDVYGLVVGKDLLTGEKLSNSERALAGVFAVTQIAGSFYTAGAGSVFFAAGIKEIRILAKADARMIELAERITKIASQTGNRMNVVAEGTTDVVTLIGRDMKEIEKMKLALKEQGVTARTFTPSDAAEKEFDVVKEFYVKKKMRIPNQRLIKLKTYKENKVWIEAVREQGHTVLDVGNVSGKFSVFYSMEKSVLKAVKKVGN